MCVGSARHIKHLENQERVFPHSSLPLQGQLAQLCTSEAFPQSLVARQRSVIPTGLKAAARLFSSIVKDDKELEKSEDLQSTPTGFQYQLQQLLALDLGKLFNPHKPHLEKENGPNRNSYLTGDCEEYELITCEAVT